MIFMNNFELLIVLIAGSIIFLTLLLILFKRVMNLYTKVHESITDKIVLKIAVPVRNDKKALSAEQLFQSLHGIIKNEEKSPDHYSFEIFATSHGIYFIVVCSSRYKTFLENQLYAQYPEAQISVIKDYVELSESSNIVSSELVLGKEFFLPIKTFTSFEVDPLASITSSVSNLSPGFEAWIQILARPIDNRWQLEGKKFAATAKNQKDSQGNAVAVSEEILQNLSEIERKSSKVGYQFIIRIIVKGPELLTCQHYLEDAEASFKQFQTAKQNSIIKPKKKKRNLIHRASRNLGFFLYGKRAGDKLKITEKFVKRFLDEREKNIVNIEELASIYHLPNESVKTPNISWAKSKKLEYPLNLPVVDLHNPEPGTRLFGLTDYRNIHLPFGVKSEDRRRHMYLLGKTGSGKSTLLKNMIVGDILEGKGLAVLDPHGDLVEELLDIIPEYRIKDVIYLDPSDIQYPIGLNMLDLNEDETMDLLADGIVSVFKKFFGDSWGPRLQYILANTLLTLLHCQNVSLLAVQRILTDKNYRKFLLKQVNDPFLLKFWNDEFEQMSQNPRMLAEALAPIQNKVGRFLSSPMVRNMIGQIKSSINLSDIMNTQKIFLVNLSQGKIGEENSSLLGGMLVTRLYTNAMQRAKIDKAERKDFYLYVDEFQNFATESFIKILSEARKYGLNLIVTHQYIDQIDPTIQDSIFGNVGTLMNYVVGQKDALRLEKEYTPYLSSEDLVNLDRFRLSMKMTIDGAQTPPFTAIAMKPNYQVYELKNQVKEFSRNTYAKPREVVEQKLNKWASQQYDKSGNLVQQKA
jgi:energy-coupling factor transporter ATP-binding protein EcfA2